MYFWGNDLILKYLSLLDLAIRLVGFFRAGLSESGRHSWYQSRIGLIEVLGFKLNPGVESFNFPEWLNPN